MIREYLSAYLPLKAAQTETVGSRTGYALDKLVAEDKVDFRTLAGRKILYILYRRDTLSWRIVNTLAALTVARGFKIIPPNEKARKIIKEFLIRLHKTDPVNAALVWIKSISKDSSWSGDGWWERKYSEEWTQEEDPFEVKNNSIIGLKKIHPLTMDFKRSANREILLDNEGRFGEKGEFLAYTQTLEDNYKKRDIDKRRVCHLKFNEIGDEQLGISDLESIYKTRHRGMSIEDGIAQGAFRHGVPFLDVEIGDEQHPPDKEMIEKAQEEVKGSSYMSEFVHPPWYKTKMMEQFSLAKSEGVLDPYIRLACAASGLPRALVLGSGEGTNKATLKELIALLPDIVIAPRQRVLKLFLEDQLFAPLMEMNKIYDYPYVQWNEIFPPDAATATKMQILSKVIFGTKPLISWEEAREMMKMPSQEEKTIYALSRQELSANTRGIYLTEPHGKLIYEGLKKSIVTKKNYPEMAGIPLVLVSGKEAFGKIKLEEPEKIDLADFKKTRSSHRISDEEREKWWPEAEELYLWPFKIIEMFKETKKVSVPQGIQKFISNVNFIEERKMFNISEGGRLEAKKGF